MCCATSLFLINYCCFRCDMYVKSLAWESTDLCYGVLCGFFFPLFAKLSAISEENDEKWLYQSANSEFGREFVRCKYFSRCYRFEAIPREEEESLGRWTVRFFFENPSNIGVVIFYVCIVSIFLWAFEWRPIAVFSRTYFCFVQW